MRTSITIIGLGFVVAKFGLLLREIGGTHVHPLTARIGALVGVLLVVSGIATTGLSALKFLQIRHDIEHGVVRFSATLDIALAIVITLAGIILAVYLIVTA